MARSFIGRCGAYLRALFGSLSAEQIEAAEAVDEAVSSAKAPKGAEVEEAGAAAAACDLSLIEGFPAAPYVESLFSKEEVAFPAFDIFTHEAKVTDSREAAGVPHQPASWLVGELWSPEAVEVMDACLLAAAAARRHGVSKAKPLGSAAKVLHAKRAAEVESLGDVRRLAAYKAAMIWCHQADSGIEADKRVTAANAKVVKGEKAARTRRAAVRGIETTDARLDRLESLLGRLAEGLEGLASVRHS